MDTRPPGNSIADNLAEFEKFIPTARFGADSAVVEVRALKIPDGKYQRNLCGFFDLACPEQLWKAIAPLLLAPEASQPEGIYLTLNEVSQDFLARANGRLKDSRRHAISVNDDDLACRRHVLIDVDPVRPAGISATDVEKAAALKLVQDVRVDLSAQGWPEPLLLDSGNGYHLWYPIHLPAKDGGLVKQVLLALAARHDTAAARVDTTVHNPSRITKLPGTWARKGDSLPDRPHRLSRVMEVPPLAERQIATLLQLEAIAATHIARASEPIPTRQADPNRGRRKASAGPSDARAARCQKYLAKLPPAIEGERGSDRTYEAARLIWNDFAIDEAEGWPLFCEWNQQCRPPWPHEGGSQSLRRKWNEAVAKGSDRRGSKLHDRRPSGAQSTDSSPSGASEQRFGVELIFDYFRDRYRPVFRRGNAVLCFDGRELPMAEACAVPDTQIILTLMTAADAPQLRNGGVNRHAIPAFFRTWSRVAWGDLMISLPEEDEAPIGSAAPAREEFRRLVREALLSEVVLGDTISDDCQVTRTERRSLIDWCRKFAKTGRWKDIRSKRCWCKLIEVGGGELKLRVAIRHEVFAQLKADRRLSAIGSNAFSRRAARYGVGGTSRSDRPHGISAVVLEQAFVDDLIADLTDEAEASSDHNSQVTSGLGE